MQMKSTIWENEPQPYLMHLKEPSVCLTSHSESASLHLNFTLLTKRYVLANSIKSLLVKLLFAK